MRSRGPALLLISMLASAAGASELTPVRAFREFTRRSAPELPESIVVDLLQDETGLLWISTVAGLATYDGVAVRAVTDAAAPRSGAVLTPRAAGGLYAGSRRGVHAFDGQRWKRLPTAAPVASVVEVEHGVWAIFDGALWRSSDLASWQPVELPGGLGRPQALFSDRRGGAFLLGTASYQHCRAGNCRPFLAGLPPGSASSALVASSGAFWVGNTEGRVATATPDDRTWTTIDLGHWPSTGIRALAEDRRGRIWAGGSGRLCHGREGSPAWDCWGPEHGLPASDVLSLLGDREGTLWLGLNGAGLRQWVGEAWSHLTRWPGDPVASGLEVVGLAPAEGGVLAAVFGRGVLRWDGRRITTWGKAEGLREDVRAVVEPGPGQIWAAGRHGVFELGPDGRFHRTLALKGFASGFARDPQGRWHVWTDGEGVLRRTGSGWESVEERGLVSHLAWAGNGDRWLATTTELLVNGRDGVERHALGLEHGLPESIQTSLEVRPGEMWVGGSRGLAIFRDGGSRLLGVPDGVPGNVYFLRSAPDGSIWVGGSRGIARFRDGRFETVDGDSGLLSEECNRAAVVLPDGSLLAGTSGSLARYDASVAPLPAPPLHVFWREPAAPVQLPAGQRRLRVAWSAPWLGPRPVESSTRVGEAWSPPTRASELTIENLPAGRSEIELRSRLVGSEEWTAPARLTVDVEPRLWETSAARAAALLAAGFAMLAAAHLHARRSQTRALARLRSDFITTASHELRTPIAQIRLFADTLRLGRARDENERAEAFDTIHRATLRLESLAGNLLQLARGQAEAPALIADNAAVDEQLHAVAREAAPVARSRGMTVTVDAPAGLRGRIDAEGLRRVLANLVDNAIKYGPPGQSVQLGARPTPEGLRLWVEDRGPGIPPADRERVFQRFVRLDRDRDSATSGTGIGLAVVREMVARGGGRTFIEDARPGARVVIVLPQPERAP